VTSNVTADFGVVSTAVALGFYPSLPAGVKFRVSFTDPVSGLPYDVVVYNDSGVIRVVYNAAPCVLNTPYIIMPLPNYIFAYPDVSQFVATANNNGITWYTKDGQVVTTCSYSKKYTSVTCYSIDLGTQVFTFTLGNGQSVIIAVRPVVAGAVKPSGNAQIVLMTG